MSSSRSNRGSRHLCAGAGAGVQQTPITQSISGSMIGGDALRLRRHLAVGEAQPCKVGAKVVGKLGA